MHVRGIPANDALIMSMESPFYCIYVRFQHCCHNRSIPCMCKLHIYMWYRMELYIPNRTQQHRSSLRFCLIPVGISQVTFACIRMSSASPPSHSSLLQAALVLHRYIYSVKQLEILLRSDLCPYRCVQSSRYFLVADKFKSLLPEGMPVLEIFKPFWL